MENTYTLYTPQPRFAETQEVTPIEPVRHWGKRGYDLLTALATEEQAAREADQLAALAVWLKESN